MRNMNRRAFMGLAGAGAASLVLAACGRSSQTEVTSGDADGANAESTDTVATDAPTTVPADGSAAVVWFSWSGNTAGIATRIAEATGAQAFQIVPEKAYPEDYDECTDVALQEQRNSEMPTYQGDVNGWENVSVVYLGYPIWWMDLPQIVKSFIADHDWAGKTVVPFSTYFSSGWAGTPDTITESCEGATLAEGLSLGQNDLPGAYDQVEGWLANLAL